MDEIGSQFWWYALIKMNGWKSLTICFVIFYFWETEILGIELKCQPKWHNRHFHLFNYPIFHRRTPDSLQYPPPGSLLLQILHRTSPRWPLGQGLWSCSAPPAAWSPQSGRSSRGCPCCGRLRTCTRCSGSRFLGHRWRRGWSFGWLSDIRASPPSI